MAVIMNCLPHAIPKEYELTFEEQQDRAELELRSNLRLSADPRGLKPLDAKERARYRAYKAQRWLEKAPRWNGVEFPFAACGKQGSAYDLPDGVAHFIIDKYNKGVEFVMQKASQEILHIVRADEALPPGVVPIRPNIVDPKNFSSESYISGGKVISGGYAPPPPLQDPLANAITPSQMREAGLIARGQQAEAAANARLETAISAAESIK